MIYDCFCFFNELEILELRLNILDSVVDKFVICESTVTHTGQPKKMYFEENKDRFSKFLHKIIHLKISDTPDDFVNLPPTSDECVKDIYRFIETTNCFDRSTQPHYGRDFFQKECIRRGLIDCSDDDIIISSDCDEIPNPKVLSNINHLFNTEFFYSFNQTTYYYYLNMLKEYNWKGSRMGTYGKLKKYSYNELRAQNNIDIPNGGWHFSFIGGADRVKTKIQSYSAQEMNNHHVINSIDNNIKNDIDPFFRSKLTKINLDNTFPDYLLDNKDKYENLIK